MDNMTPWKDALRDHALYGCFVTFGLPDFAEYTARLGFDFTLIDNEHGLMEKTTLNEMVRASQCAGVPAVIRLPEKSYDYIQHALDMGANGIQLPLLNTAEEAKKVVELSNYAPEGKRGVAYLPRSSSYGMVKDKEAYRKEANRVKLVSCQVETVEAMKNLDEILAVDGIDVYFIGPADLSSSMGTTTADPAYKKMLLDAIRRITAAGKIAGYYVGNPEEAKEAEEAGARFLVTSLNAYMTKGALDFLGAVRKQ